jgi:hypothetical protein
MNLRSLRPAYLLKRLAQMRFERAHPDAPWLAESAVVLLDTYLKPTDIGFEWGSGRSTLWFAQRVAHLYSVEENEHWHDDIRASLKAQNLLGKVTYRFIPCDCHEIDEPAQHPYADVARAVQENSLDFAIVDGNIRVSCIRAIIPKLKSGGLLILDNANRYFPNRYAGGNTTVHEPRAEMRTHAWAGIAEQLTDWRWLNTTNGIWDTRLWIKPSPAPVARSNRTVEHELTQELPWSGD